MIPSSPMFCRRSVRGEPRRQGRSHQLDPHVGWEAAATAVVAEKGEVKTRPPFKFKHGDRVEKTTGDYRYKGIVVAAFSKLNGSPRYVVENADGMLFIFNEQQLEGRDEQRV
jgi:hypothetical protein